MRSVNFYRSLLEASLSDHNLVYAKVCIPRRSAPNRRKRDSTKKTPKLTDLRRLMTDPSLRCQVQRWWLAHYHQSPLASASVTSPPTWPTSCFPLRPNWYRALNARAEHRVGARGPVWGLKLTQHGSRERMRGGIYAQNLTTATFERP